MLRTSLRSRRTLPGTDFVREFLSSNAQDFIEDRHGWPRFTIRVPTFLSSNAQDFIEERKREENMAENIEQIPEQ